jgi:hypothetical protein
MTKRSAHRTKSKKPDTCLLTQIHTVRCSHVGKMFKLHWCHVISNYDLCLHRRGPPVMRYINIRPWRTDLCHRCLHMLSHTSVQIPVCYVAKLSEGLKMHNSRTLPYLYAHTMSSKEMIQTKLSVRRTHDQSHGQRSAELELSTSWSIGPSLR